MLTRREFLKFGAATGAAVGVGATLPANWLPLRMRRHRPAAPDVILDPTTIDKYQVPMVIPPAMPPTDTSTGVDYYEITVRQFQQQILPATLPATTVWSYGSANHPSTFNYPAFTVEADYNVPVRVKWINGLVDDAGNFLPHLLPVDQTIHWANPPGGEMHRDHHGMDQAPYAGPVPIVTHVHGAHTTDDSDGYAEAWYLPSANNIPAGYASVGTWYDFFRAKFLARSGVAWDPGSAVFEYPNDQRATTLWYHDHTLGMTRTNVYAGPAGFYLLRGGPDDQVNGVLPGPAPSVGDLPGIKYYEIPIAIQDRTFNDDGSLFYPDNRAFFEGLEPPQLQIPFTPDVACDGMMSDVAPIWNPEFFGNAIVVNGSTWPYLEVEQRRYRFRFLNGCNSRFLILKFENDHPFWQIGTEGGFLPAPVQLTQLLMAPAERADVIVDFTNAPLGNLLLINIGPDEPFGGGVPGIDFPVADPATTGQVMQFRVVPIVGTDPSTLPDQLGLPAITPLPAASVTRSVSLNELDSESVRVSTDGQGNVVLDCADGEPFGPAEAALGVLNPDGTGLALGWDDPITETPTLGDTEVWEIHNFTMDAHPIHIHEVQFEVVNREDMMGMVRDPEPWETGFKDTVIAYPDEITRVKARFDIPGLYVWHCHIVEHEDNEMMRPFRIVQRTYLPFVPKGS